MKYLYFLTAILSLASAIPISDIRPGTNKSQDLRRRNPPKQPERPGTPHPKTGDVLSSETDDIKHVGKDNIPKGTNVEPKQDGLDGLLGLRT